MTLKSIGINSEASKAVTSETLFTAKTPEIAIQNSSKKRVATKDSVILELYTTNKIYNFSEKKALDSIISNFMTLCRT